MIQLLIFPMIQHIFFMHITTRMIKENDRLIQLKFDEYNKIILKKSMFKSKMTTSHLHKVF